MIELNTKQKGNLTEINCISEFIARGINVSIPYGDCARYDFIIDIDNKLYKIQCKTANEESQGVYKFSCRSCHTRATGNSRRTYNESEIDFFCTYINNQCYLIPIAEASSNNKTLRFVPTKNLQNVTYATAYELDKQIAKLK